MQQEKRALLCFLVATEMNIGCRGILMAEKKKMDRSLLVLGQEMKTHRRRILVILEQQEIKVDCKASLLLWQNKTTR
jgi:hypothetical protein